MKKEDSPKKRRNDEQQEKQSKRFREHSDDEEQHTDNIQATYAQQRSECVINKFALDLVLTMLLMISLVKIWMIMRYDTMIREICLNISLRMIKLK
jgi:hypothetical protein